MRQEPPHRALPGPASPSSVFMSVRGTMTSRTTVPVQLEDRVDELAVVLLEHVASRSASSTIAEQLLLARERAGPAPAGRHAVAEGDQARRERPEQHAHEPHDRAPRSAMIGRSAASRPNAARRDADEHDRHPAVMMSTATMSVSHHGRKTRPERKRHQHRRRRLRQDHAQAVAAR